MTTKRLPQAIAAASIVAFSGMGESIMLSALANPTNLAQNNLLMHRLSIITTPNVRVTLRGIANNTNNYSFIKEPEAESRKEVDKTATKSVPYRGRFKVFYKRVQNPSYKRIEALLLDLRLYEKIAYAFNKNLYVPRNINIISTECGQEDAFYAPKYHAIVMCYELIAQYAKFADQFATSQQDLNQAVIGMTLFTLFHELGHTFIHELDLPAVGREEDVADQLAVVILTAGEHPIGEISLVSVANLFKQFGETTPVPYWDVHPLDRQRYYNIMCLLYGSNPSKYASLPIQAGLPGTRARGCSSEYTQARNSWWRLLELSQKSSLKP